MTKKQKYLRFALLALTLIILLFILGLDEDRTIINAVRHFLKNILRAI